jgi:hypothetical protein
VSKGAIQALFDVLRGRVGIKYYSGPRECREAGHACASCRLFRQARLQEGVSSYIVAGVLFRKPLIDSACDVEVRPRITLIPTAIATKNA